MQKIRKAETSDFPWIIETLVDGFNDDDLFKYYVREDEKRLQALFGIFEFSICEIASSQCEIWVLDDKAIAIIIPPNVKPSTSNIFKLFSVFGFACGLKKISRLIRMALLLPKHREKSPHYYVWFLASNIRGQGFGGELLSSLIEKYGINGQKIALETCNANNVSFYSKLGFKLQEQFKIAKNSPNFYTMLYEN